MITRAQYMAGEATHDEYYTEIALALRPRIPFSVAAVKAALAAGDKALNTLPLPHWDAAWGNQNSGYHIADVLKPRGEWNTLGVGVCILKAYARYLATKETT